MFLTLVLFTCGRPVAAQDRLLRIAAVVNDQIISMYDLSSRIRLIMTSAGLQDTPETRQRLVPVVLRSLIDETLELQEAKRLNVTVSTDDIQQAIARIAQQNNMSESQLREFFMRSNIPLAAIVGQARAAIAWSKVIAQKIRPTIEIGDDQVEDYLHRLKTNQGKPQFHLQEIFLAVDSPQQEDEVRRTAERLAEQIGNGANFTVLARQFSQSATAAVGGDLGWVEEGALDPELEKVAERLDVGQLSKPVRTVSGYHLLLLRDRRQSGASEAENAELKLEHFFLPGPPNATPEDIAALRSVAQSVSDSSESCADFANLRKSLPDAKTVLPEQVKAADLSPVLRAAALKLPVGKASEPITLNNGVFVMMICESQGGNGLPGAEEVRNRLIREKLDLLTRRYLRDLRQAAFVDVRT